MFELTSKGLNHYLLIPYLGEGELVKYKEGGDKSLLKRSKKKPPGQTAVGSLTIHPYSICSKV